MLEYLAQKPPFLNCAVVSLHNFEITSAILKLARNLAIDRMHATQFRNCVDCQKVRNMYTYVNSSSHLYTCHQFIDVTLCMTCLYRRWTRAWFTIVMTTGATCVCRTNYWWKQVHVVKDLWAAQQLANAPVWTRNDWWACVTAQTAVLWHSYWHRCDTELTTVPAWYL